jgi:RNA polymerase sigma-70 factor (ECF subfamily)
MIGDYSDKTLIEELKKGSYHAFDSLFARYGNQLYGFVYGILKVKDDSKEVVQEVFVKVWEKRLNLDEYSSFKSFLFSIAYHHIISGFRKKISEKKYINDRILSFNNQAIPPDLMVEYKMLSERIDEIIATLPAQRKGIFVMSRFEGLSHSEIASKLHISVKTVENHINLTLRTLRIKLGDFLSLILFFF